MDIRGTRPNPQARVEVLRNALRQAPDGQSSAPRCSTPVLPAPCDRTRRPNPSSSEAAWRRDERCRGGWDQPTPPGTLDARTHVATRLRLASVADPYRVRLDPG